MRPPCTQPTDASLAVGRRPGGGCSQRRPGASGALLGWVVSAAVPTARFCAGNVLHPSADTSGMPPPPSTRQHQVHAPRSTTCLQGNLKLEARGAQGGQLCTGELCLSGCRWARRGPALPVGMHLCTRGRGRHTCAAIPNLQRAGTGHLCGMTTTGQALCWGDNWRG